MQDQGLACDVYFTTPNPYFLKNYIITQYTIIKRHYGQIHRRNCDDVDFTELYASFCPSPFQCMMTIPTSSRPMIGVVVVLGRIFRGLCASLQHRRLLIFGLLPVSRAHIIMVMDAVKTYYWHRIQSIIVHSACS